MSARDWIWAEVNPGAPALAGDIAKMFRHEEQKAPGIFAADAPPDAAVLLAREVIQNSWDAARDLQQDDPSAPQFAIQFRFLEVTGDEKASLVEALGLRDLAVRASKVNRAEVGLTESNCLSDPLNAVEEVARIAAEQGLEPSEPPKPLPVIELSDIHLVCWQAIVTEE